jgi:hypothetical protein
MSSALSKELRSKHNVRSLPFFYDPWVQSNILNSAVRFPFAKMTRLELFEESTKVVRAKLRKFTARNGLSTSTAYNETSQTVQPLQLVFIQAMLSLPPSNWTPTGVLTCTYCFELLTISLDGPFSRGKIVLNLQLLAVTLRWLR